MDPEVNRLVVRLLRLSAAVIILWALTLTVVTHRDGMTAQAREAYGHIHRILGMGPEER